MKLPRQLTKRQLVKIVEEIRDWLYMDEDSLQDISDLRSTKLAIKLEKKAQDLHALYEYVNPDKSWDSAADILNGISDALKNFNLVPTKYMTADEVYRKPTPNENWKDDSIQFPRLLNELDCLAVVDLLDAADQTDTGMLALEQSMDLTRKEIMQIFDRAQKEWDRIKKETK